MTWIDIITTILTPGGIVIVIFQSGKLIQKMKMFEIRMDKFDTRMDKFDERMDKFDERMSQFEWRLNKLAIQVAKIRVKLQGIGRTRDK